MNAKKGDELRAICESLAAQHFNTPTGLSRGLELLGIDLALHEEPFRDDLSVSGAPDPLEYLCGDANDGGMDGLVYDEELTTVSIVQCKYKAGAANAETLEECRSFFNRLDEWLDTDSWARYNERARSLLEASGLDAEKQEIRLYFLTSQSAGNSIEQEAQGVAEDAVSRYASMGYRVSCTFLSRSSILRDYRAMREAMRAPTVPSVRLGVQSDASFIFSTASGHRVLVCAVKGNEIRTLYNKTGVGQSLFNANIRSALTTGKINPQVQKTAKDPQGARDFFLFNNGITATCTSFQPDGHEFAVEGMQVVNGAQTVNALKEALRTPNPELYVLLRLIETSGAAGGELAERITRFQNTQNPVKASDFYSNDPIQLWLRDHLPAESGNGAVPAFWYENKRGASSKPKGAKGRKITIEQLALLRYACLEDAPFTYKKAKDVWDSQDQSAEYWKAFGSQGTSVALWTPEEVAEATWMVRCWLSLRDTQQEMKTGKATKVEIEYSYLGVLARYITALTFRGMQLRLESGKFASFRDLMGSEQLCATIEAPVVAEARRLVRSAYRDWGSRNIANPRLNMPQDAKTWTDLLAALQEELAAGGFL